MLNVLVTGASRGIGLGIAQTLASAGFSVIAIARKPAPPLDAAIAAARDGPGALQFRPFDLENIAGIAELVKSLRKEIGQLYGIVNNAGIGTGGVLANMPDPAIERLIRLNILSPITLTKYAVRSMMTGKGGRIVNISSIVGATGYNGLSVYSATKASLHGFTRSLARELGPLGITVNTVSPGFVDTEMTHELNPGQREQIIRRSALRRMTEIQDIADAVAFLCSQKAANITGINMTIDAGNTA